MFRPLGKHTEQAVKDSRQEVVF